MLSLKNVSIFSSVTVFQISAFFCEDEIDMVEICVVSYGDIVLKETNVTVLSK